MSYNLKTKYIKALFLLFIEFKLDLTQRDPLQGVPVTELTG